MPDMTGLDKIEYLTVEDNKFSDPKVFRKIASLKNLN
jgi:hypothetical protein